MSRDVSFDYWRNHRCVRCGRFGRDVVLDVESFIHHGGELVCKDRKCCERYVRRLRKRGVK